MDDWNIVLGVRDGWGGETPFALASHDRRHHLYAIGKSGTGKTTLLRNLILQDIAAGRGVGVIDPHGDLASALRCHAKSCS
jgi:type IV secretory pathway VirB4 component